jgi:hypothetical protein
MHPPSLVLQLGSAACPSAADSRPVNPEPLDCESAEIAGNERIRTMSLSYHEDGKRLTFGAARFFLILNALLAFGMTFYWSGFGSLVGEPFRWAMSDAVSPVPSLFEYPYLTLWLLPTLCMCGGWLAIKGQYPVATKAIGMYPWMLLSLMLGWFYLTPAHWH